MYDTTKPYTKNIKEMIRLTWNTPYLSVKEGIYPIQREKIPESVLRIEHTDGIGTKGVYHWNGQTYENAAIDSLAMNLNDMAMARAVPYKLQNHIIVPEERGINESISKLCEECLLREIAITGGETSIQNNIKGMDISLTVSGFVFKEMENKIVPGDYIVGLPSSGIHSNGFTKVREIFGVEFRKEFVEPTRIYDEVYEISDRFDVHGMMHITGGAFTKLKGIIGKSNIEIFQDHILNPQKIFYEIYGRGVNDSDMYKTFNCGIGFVISLPEEESEDMISEYPKTDIIGKAVSGNGNIRIKSAFSDKLLEY